MGAERRFAYRRSPDQDYGTPARHRAVVVGAGPVGLAFAVDLAQRGIPALVLDDDDRLSTGSRAICFAKRTLEIFDRLGVGDRMVDKGVRWQVGKVFVGDALAYRFDLLPERGHKRPAFINLQQYYVEEFLADRGAGLAGLELRWRHRVVDVVPAADHVALTIDTPDGPYRIAAEWLIAADGARSTVRAALGLEAKGRAFRDRFLIADVRMKADFPTERWFWFDPPFHRGQSVLLHKQPDDVWRIDFQLGPEADPEQERQPERVLPRLRALLGPEVAFTLEWVSVYGFACERMERFRHGRVLFIGDAAHRVSPFGARGANSGIQDADNLAWKLAFVLHGWAPERLLDSYDAERVAAADENILASTRSTDFITPKTAQSRVFRDAVLALAREAPFARTLVNSGRLSTPTTYDDSPLSTADRDAFAGLLRPGAPAADAPVGGGWLLDRLGPGFNLLCFGAAAPDAGALGRGPIPVAPLEVGADRGAVVDDDGLLAERYDARPGTCVLFRPDQHVAARWRSVDPAAVRAAVARATAQA